MWNQYNSHEKLSRYYGPCWNVAISEVLKNEYCKHDADRNALSEISLAISDGGVQTTLNSQGVMDSNETVFLSSLFLFARPK